MIKAVRCFLLFAGTPLSLDFLEPWVLALGRGGSFPTSRRKNCACAFHRNPLPSRNLLLVVLEPSDLAALHCHRTHLLRDADRRLDVDLVSVTTGNADWPAGEARHDQVAHSF